MQQLFCLLRAHSEWHDARGIPAVSGQNRRENGSDIIRWCFSDLVTAALFQKELVRRWTAEPIPQRRVRGIAAGPVSHRQPEAEHKGLPFHGMVAPTYLLWTLALERRTVAHHRQRLCQALVTERRSRAPACPRSGERHAQRRFRASKDSNPAH